MEISSLLTVHGAALRHKLPVGVIPRFDRSGSDKIWWLEIFSFLHFFGSIVTVLACEYGSDVSATDDSTTIEESTVTSGSK